LGDEEREKAMTLPRVIQEVMEGRKRRSMKVSRLGMDGHHLKEVPSLKSIHQ
jgi:hypothetical protein